jgi:pimeloyl-ACP methyl ester carboxylesterase
MLCARDVVVSGVRSSLLDSGPTDRREAVVFVHGNPGPRDDWEFVLPEVAKHARAIALDMPGFGRSDRPRSMDFSPAGYGRYLAAVLSELGVASAHLVLHDFGGAWGLHWALSQPRDVLSITLINSVPVCAFRWHFFARVWQTPVLGELFQASTTDYSIRWVMNHGNPRPFPEAFAKRLLSFADLRQKFIVLKLYRAVRDTRAVFASMQPELAKLNVPACVIWGESDPYLPPEYAESFRQAFPDCEVHRLPGLGHWPFIDDEAAVRAPMLAFLRRVGALPVADSDPVVLGSAHDPVGPAHS